MFGGEGVQPVPDRLAPLNLLQLPVGAVTLVGQLGLTGGRLIVQGDGHGQGGAALFPPQKVDAYVGGQPVQPGGEGALALKPAQPLPGVEKGLLAQLRRIVRIAGHAQGQAVDAPLIALHQRRERLLAALPGPLDQHQLRFHAVLTCLSGGGGQQRSRCMPAVMRSMSARVLTWLICSL